MFETLNLLPKTQLKLKRANQTVAMIQTLAKVLAVVFFLIIVGEYAWAAFTNNQIQNTRSRSNILMDEIEGQSETEGRYLYYQQALNTATNLVENRKNFLSSLTELYSRLEQGVAIEAITFTAGRLLFTGTAPNVQIFSETLANFKSQNEQSLFGNMVLTNSSRLPDGRYNFKVDIELLSSPGNSRANGN